MSKKKFSLLRILIFLVCSLILGVVLFIVFPNPASSAGIKMEPKERFTYAIKKLGIKVGVATLEYQGRVVKDGQEFVLIIFTAKGFNFFDQERIFAHPDTLLPSQVERTVDFLGKKEKIVEFYDDQKHHVEVVKYGRDGEPVDTKVYQRTKPLDNLYCFLFRYRDSGDFKDGAQFSMYLPTKDIDFEILHKVNINFYNGARQAWLMESRPKQYRVWFGIDDGHIPLRIDGAVGIAKAAMILTGYESGKIK